jgi:hypothetical protein
METQLFDNYAIYWGLGFLLVYLAAQLFVMKHPWFANYSQLKKSFTVKIVALIGFVLLYAGIHFLFLR